MNDKAQTELQQKPELFDLGDAKELTKAIPSEIFNEDNPLVRMRGR